MFELLRVLFLSSGDGRMHQGDYLFREVSSHNNKSHQKYVADISLIPFKKRSTCKKTMTNYTESTKSERERPTSVLWES